MHRLLGLFLSMGLTEKRRHKVRLVVHSLLPILLTIFVIHVPQNKTASSSGESYENDLIIQDNLADYFPGELVNKLFYTPQTELTENLMETVRQQLFIVDERVVPFASDAEMEFALLDNPYICFGVSFLNISDGGVLSFVIRTKNNNFRTDDVYSQDVFSSYQKRDNEYVESGFLALQNAVDQSYVSMLAKQNNNIAEPKLHVAYGHILVDDKKGPQEPIPTIHLMTVLAVVFVIIDIFALLLPMVEERANGMREHLKIASLQSYWKEVALFILNFIQFCVDFLICLAIAVGSGFWDATAALVVYLIILSALFVTNLITFTFFLSTTVESPTVATAAAPIIFFGPYFLSILSTKLVLPFGVFPVTGLCYAGLTLDVFKSSGHLFQAHNLFTVGYPGLQNISLFRIFVGQLFGSALWLFLWFYVSNVFPGRYGTPKSKGFFLSKSYRTRLSDSVKNRSKNTNKITAESQHDLQQNSSASNELDNNFETISMEYIDQAADPIAVELDQPSNETSGENSKPVVRISKLNKVFKGRTGGAKLVVKDFSLSIYSQSLTVLLGHNGAGKTTTMNIITGILPRTSGTIVVDGEHDANQYRQRIGFCPQHNVFFSFLNCRQHLEFFGCLRGLSKAEARNEAKIVLEKVNLLDKSESLVHTLSGGMKRRLSLANAIIGHTKLLILDEPTSGLDPESRRDIWDVLLKLRQKHTILLTTHFMEEADVLADWVAIMEEGALVAFGSPLYLKREYGKGYTLKLFKAKNFDERQTWSLIQHHVPKAFVRDSVQEIFAVTLPYDDVAQYAAMLKELEVTKKNLGIETIGMANATLEEVFLNSSTRKKDLQHHPESVDCVDSPPDPLTNEVTSRETGSKTTPLHAKNVCFAIWRKKWIHMKCNKHIYGFLHALPLLVTVLCFLFTTGKIDAAKTLPAVTLNADVIDQALGVLVINRATDSGGNEVFRNLETIESDFKRSTVNGVRMVVEENVSLLDSLRKRIAEDYTGYRDRVVVAIECNITGDAVEVTVLYNNNLVHSTGIAESVFATILLRYYAGVPDAIVHTDNIPSTRKQLIDIKTPFFFTELIAIAFMFYMLIYLTVPLHEHLTGFRQLQNINRYVYWTGTYLFDLFVHTLLCVLVIVLVGLLDHNEAFSELSKVHIFFILWLYGVLALVVIYIISQCVESANTAITIMSYLMIVGVACVLMLSNGYDDIKNNAPWIAILHIVPEFALKHSMRVVYENQKLIIYEHMSKQQNREHSTTFANKRIYPTTFYIIAPFVFVALVVILNEVVENMYTRERVKIRGELASENIRKVVRQVSRSISREDERSKINRQPEEGDGRDETDSPVTNCDDVDQQTKLVNHLIESKEDSKQYAIIVKALKKTYSQHEAVKCVSFAVKKGECFGLLGMNGAGKTTVFQMLSRNLPASEGKIYLQHCEVREADALEYRHQYGYCPQFDVLLDFMTVYEVIDYFAQLKGVEARDTHITSWLVKLDILQYKDHTLDECSGGTKRKVTTILALLGGPSVVLLDEPTTGVDPKSRHFLWKTIKAIQRKNQTILLTSHSMDECEELCNRLSIMVDGQLRCVGTIPELKKRHGQGYNLWIKLNITLIDRENVAGDFAQLIHEVTECCKAKLQEEHKGLLKFVVSPSLELSELFHQVVELKEKRTEQILTYSIYETSLEDIFLNFRPKKQQHG
ncbi:ATP-binding cassette sub-family A member 2 [Anopheles funestus]|uniref:ATP-binding cassette sub-family A member 2 n=1 Tax=Anopheles funestus TaxID=62324 RepID=UPI0020C73CCE|nr:ATP-binding cassette sub-family A member 2 [Anopheles funestus]